MFKVHKSSFSPFNSKVGQFFEVVSDPVVGKDLLDFLH